VTGTIQLFYTKALPVTLNLKIKNSNSCPVKVSQYYFQITLERKIQPKPRLNGKIARSAFIHRLSYGIYSLETNNHFSILARFDREIAYGPVTRLRK